MTQFDTETALTRNDEHRFTGHVHPAWNIGDNPNGGYLAAIAMNALQQLMPDHPDPLSLTLQYLRPGSSEADCEVTTRLVRVGRTITTATATLAQDGKPRLEAMASLGNLDGEADTILAMPAPRIPPPDECILRAVAQQGVDVHIAKRLEIRLNPDDTLAAMAKDDAQGTVHPVPRHAGSKSMTDVARAASVTGWLRFRDGRAPDTRALVLFADAFPPPIFGLLGVVGWVPTIELTVHVRRRPVSPSGWILAHFETRDLTGGRLIEDGTLWDEQGNLVARSRQLALLPVHLTRASA